MKVKALLALTFSFVTLALLVSCSDQPTRGSSTLSDEEQQAFVGKGKVIAAASFEALSTRLKAAIAREGVPGALEYCNLVALPLLDSLSAVHKATIRRSSFRIRNPEDKPTDWEQSVLTDYEKAESEGRELRPIVQSLNENTVAFAAPIRMLPLCLQCHGVVGQELTESNYQIIKKLYPQDQAINYKEGELRGIWSITFNR